MTAMATGVLAAGAYAYAGMWPTSQIFGRCVVAAKNLARLRLTFDDGPNDPDTFRLLEVLAKHNVRATFFYDWAICEGNARKLRGPWRRMGI